MLISIPVYMVTKNTRSTGAPTIVFYGLFEDSCDADASTIGNRED